MDDKPVNNVRWKWGAVMRQKSDNSKFFVCVVRRVLENSMAFAVLGAVMSVYVNGNGLLRAKSW